MIALIATGGFNLLVAALAYRHGWTPVAALNGFLGIGCLVIALAGVAQ